MNNEPVVWTACLDCGKKVTGDSIHTCSPQLKTLTDEETKKGTKEMKIELKIINENEDGSANAMVDFDKEGLEFLVQEGIIHILEQYIEQNKNAQEGQKLRKKLTKKQRKDIDPDGRC